MNIYIFIYLYVNKCSEMLTILDNEIERLETENKEFENIIEKQ